MEVEVPMPTIPDTYAEIVFRYTLSGDPQVMTNALGIATPGINDLIQEQTLCDDLSEVMGQFFEDNVLDSYTYVGAELTVNDSGVMSTFETIDSRNSGVSGQPLPQNCAFLIRKVTGQAGRANRGRWFFCAGITGEVDVNAAGVLAGAGVTALQGLFSGLMTDLLAVTNVDDLVVLHTDPLATPTVITALSVQQIIATQRRRLRP